MKKFSFLAILIILPFIVFAQNAEADETGFGIDVDLGATFEYGDNIVSDNMIDFLGTFLTAFRVGGFGDFYYRVNEYFAAGAEVGIYAFASENGSTGETVVTPYVDIPLRAFARGSFFGMDLQIGTGYNFATGYDYSAVNYLGIFHKLDVGARLSFSGFYIEYNHLFWWDKADALKGSDRVGLGYSLKLL